MFLHLSFQIVDSLLNLIKDATFKCDILYDIHFTANLFFSTIVSNEAYSCTGEEILRTFAKKEDTSGADLDTFTFVCQETFILMKILHRGLPITNPLYISPDSVHINVLYCGVVGRAVFIIAFSQKSVLRPSGIYLLLCTSFSFTLLFLAEVYILIQCSFDFKTHFHTKLGKFCLLPTVSSNGVQKKHDFMNREENLESKYYLCRVGIDRG